MVDAGNYKRALLLLEQSERLHGPPREAVESPSLEIFKTCWDRGFR